MKKPELAADVVTMQQMLVKIKYENDSLMDEITEFKKQSVSQKELLDEIARLKKQNAEYKAVIDEVAELKNRSRS